MPSSAVFGTARRSAALYESFYLRAVDPEMARGVWIRHTVHKRPGAQATGAVWFTLFEAGCPPVMQKRSGAGVRVPASGWIAVGDHAAITPSGADGACGAARWSLRFRALDGELAHLSPRLLYRTPLPRTKLTSPAPCAEFDGTLELEGRAPIELRGWPGMVGHNWGSEHAERWVWLHGVCFAGQRAAWLDVALARVKLAGRMTPWLASGAVSLDGRRARLGGIGARPHVAESAAGCELRLAGSDGLSLAAHVEVPPGTAAAWRYSSPRGGEHDVVNCSIASLRLDIEQRSGRRMLESAHGGAYELGMHETDHGVPLAPFADP